MAGNAGAIRAGRAFVEMYVDSSLLDRGLQAAAQKVQAWGESIMAIGAKIAAAGGAILAPLTGAAVGFAAIGAELQRASERTGVSVEKLSLLKYVAESAGSSFEELEGAIFKMQKALGNAAGMSEEMRLHLAGMGLSAGQFVNADTFTAALQLADGFARIANQTDRVKAAYDVIGKSGPNFLKFTQQGSASLLAKMSEGQEGGFAWSPEQARSALELEESFTRLKFMFMSVVTAIGGALVPALKAGLQTKMELVAGVVKWINANQDVIVTLFKVAKYTVLAGAAIVAIGTGVWALGAAIGVAGTALSAMVTILKLIPVTVGAINIAFAGMRAAILLLTGASTLFTTLQLGLSAVGAVLFGLISPGSVILALVAAMGVAFYGFSENGKAGIAAFGKAWEGIKTSVLDSIDGIMEAMKEGDFAGALKIATLGMQVVWAEMIAALKTQWLQYQFWLAEESGIVKVGQTATGRPTVTFFPSTTVSNVLDSIFGKKKEDEEAMPEGKLPATVAAQKTAREQEFDALLNPVRRLRMDLDETLSDQRNRRLWALMATETRLGGLASDLASMPGANVGGNSRGTFSGFEAREQYGGGSLQQQQVDLLKEIRTSSDKVAEETRRIKEKIEPGTFG